MIDHDRARVIATKGRLAARLILSDPTRRRAAIAIVAAVVVAIVAGGLAWNAGPRTDGTTTGANRPAPGTSSGVPGADDPWASLEPSGGVVAADGEKPAAAILTAEGAKGVVVPLDAGFRLTSVDTTPASQLATRLTVEPEFAFSVKPDSGDRSVLLTPAKPLLPGNVYRFALSGTAGELIDTWAFQARQPLRVVGTLPQDQTADVPVDTGIEVTFDQDGVADAASHFTITPATEGRFEQHGRTLAFVPDRPLAPATIYRVTVTRGVSVAGTGEATSVDTRVQFETAAKTEPTGYGVFEFQDQVVESATSERPTIGLWGSFEIGRASCRERV